MTTISDVMEQFYADHEVKPYISPERDLDCLLYTSNLRRNTILKICRKQMKVFPNSCIIG